MHPQGDIQITQSNVQINAKHLLAFRCKAGGNPGAKRGFAGSALAGKHGDDFAQGDRLLPAAGFYVPANSPNL